MASVSTTRGILLALTLLVSHAAGAGTQSMVVRVVSGEARTGAFAVVTLDKGTYKLAYWACADVGSTARVQAHLGGIDLNGATVGEDYKQVKQTVSIEKSIPRATLRILTTSGKTRVWFDDVALRRID